MKQHAPATERNREPLLEVLRAIVPDNGRILEVAAGTGEHAAYFAPRFPGLRWLPSDVDSVQLASICAWVEEADCSTLEPPVMIDVADAQWPDRITDAGVDVSVIVSINMLHIAPWSATVGLFTGAASLLGDDGLIFIYGPFRKNGIHTAASNARFDAWLQTQDQQWGVRDLDEVASLASGVGFRLDQAITMPANNLSLVFRR